MLTSSLSETRNQDQQRHRKGILRSGPPICPGIISFVERREKRDGEKGEEWRGQDTLHCGNWSSCAYLKRGDFGGLHLLPRNRCTLSTE